MIHLLPVSAAKEVGTLITATKEHRRRWQGPSQFTPTPSNLCTSPKTGLTPRNCQEVYSSRIHILRLKVVQSQRNCQVVYSSRIHILRLKVVQSQRNCQVVYSSRIHILRLKVVQSQRNCQVVYSSRIHILRLKLVQCQGIVKQFIPQEFVADFASDI